MIGYSRRTSAAAFFPSLTSCSGVYLFFGGLIGVCARRPAADTNNAIANADAHALLLAMTRSFETSQPPLHQRTLHSLFCTSAASGDSRRSAQVAALARGALHRGGRMPPETPLQRAHDRLAD